MKAPHLIVAAPDDWLAAQLREWAAERKWLLRVVRQWPAFAAAAGGRRPCVAVLQADLSSDGWAAALAEVRRTHPDAAAVVVSDTKLNDDGKATLTAAAVDLGARFVLFPPLTRQALEDVVSGLAEAVLLRVRQAGSAAPETAIALTEEDYEAP